MPGAKPATKGRFRRSRRLLRLQSPRYPSFVLKSGKCPKCGSPEVIRDARMVYVSNEYDTDMRVRVDSDPKALLIHGAVYSDARVYVCGACGYIEQYAATPEPLLDAWREAGN
jgi:predicted RNA-binding Zn-ribbon protein involved in translation (DUF1610 family)